LLVIPLLLAVFAAARHLERRYTRLTVAGQRIRYESGILSKTTRTMDLHKLQDVRVDQTLGQRLLDIGDISLETAGETSRITMRNVDRPRQVADQILSAADQAGRP
jgi:membrane protein YdbS with pleckstrin-like domain